MNVWVGTTDGVRRLGGGSLGLDGLEVSALHAAGDVLLAGTYGDGLFRSADAGRTWERVADGVFRFVTAELAGTEPARVYRSPDDGLSWDELPVTAIPGHENWFLPYSPRAGAARNAHVTGGTILVSAEVAGLLRSEDGGGTWVCETVAGDEDIHHVTGHGGIARSRDGGRTWEKVERDYTRATLVPPARPDLLVAGPAPRVGREGRIVVSADGGDTWAPAGDGIEVPMPDMVELFVAAPDGDVWAVCSRGRLLRATPGEWAWTVEAPAGVKSVAFS
jgi:photosystem II stability/assembly factor-like uncharacterized protein